MQAFCSAGEKFGKVHFFGEHQCTLNVYFILIAG